MVTKKVPWKLSKAPVEYQALFGDQWKPLMPGSMSGSPTNLDEEVRRQLGQIPEVFWYITPVLRAKYHDP